MSEITPRINITYPSEFEEPYFDSAKTSYLDIDAITHANADNGNIQFIGGGVMGWDADSVDVNTGLLYWSEDILITGWNTTFNARLAGPASVELQDNEILFFVMPRLMGSVADIQLYRGNRVYLEGARLSDLRLFVARMGDNLYFANGLSLKDGDVGTLFGGGLISTTVLPPHSHEDPLILEPLAGVSNLDVLLTSPDLAKLQLYRNGLIQSEPGDYSLNPATGIVTLVVPTVASERFVALRERLDTLSPTTSHSHLSRLDISPAPATVLLDMLVTSPTLEAVNLFFNGQLLSEPADYSLDLGTGFITLVVPSPPATLYSAFRRIAV